jgi:hypothetical protein
MAASLIEESKIMPGLPDLKSETQQMPPSIKRYEYVPLVSLTQAVKPLVSLSPNIEQMVSNVRNTKRMKFN